LTAFQDYATNTLASGRRIVRVLVVDDSAYVRKVVKEILSRSPFLEVVATARDGQEALDFVEEFRPDVVTLDLNMPRMDGVAFVRAQMARRFVPIVLVTVTGENNELALQALEAGAVDLVQKPTALATERVFAIGEELIEKVKAAAEARAVTWLPREAGQPAAKLVSREKKRLDVVVLGVSTGGPQALRLIIPRIPADCSVPIAMVLHMPVGYTQLYASKLNDISALTVHEAEEGEPLRAGTALLAPAGRHLSFRRTAEGTVVAHLDIQPLDTPHRPAVDVLFRSAADVYGDRVLGVVMTGMGSDGKEGAAWIKAQGGTIYTEAEETCVVYGMPRAVAEAGLSDKVLPLTAIASAIMETI
jgi:two-component system, chemotaxis family, protein-glutamate methylesterase/glutaminase